ncbi:MAG TPA: ATP-dependent Clp protease adaptor ClpS [Bacteroidales bacterium]|nr:ATP-dependent Clp protease adaptor ClpS [Bacteroidales bacterium]
MTKEKVDPVNEEATSLSETNELVLYNDDFNTFEFVIQSLIEVCHHQPEQAEQCTLIVHYKGKCAVKSGDFDQLDPLKQQLTDRGLTATIE